MTAGVVIDTGIAGPYYLVAVATFLLTLCGSTAPDWLEVAWWRRKHKLWVAHRTWTHWGVPWTALFYYSYQSLMTEPVAPLSFGFAAGALMHLICDWPNPKGLIWIYKRHSLNLWRSGRCDFILVMTAWAAAFLFIDGRFFESVHITWIASFIGYGGKLI